MLTAVPSCDGHDSAITTINLELTRHGIEVVYLGYNRSARDIARAAVQEDVRAVGISSYNGGHVEFFREVVDLLRADGATDIAVFGGGGGTITPADAAAMRRRGVSRIFFAGTPLSQMVDYVRAEFGAPPRGKGRESHGKSVGSADRILARRLSAAEAGTIAANGWRAGASAFGLREPRVVGIAGPGGAGKTTLIDELVLRVLRSRPDSQIGILSHDPSLFGNGALLGDRAAMIYAQDDRVFMRSLGTRGQAGGVAAATARCMEVLKSHSFPTPDEARDSARRRPSGAEASSISNEDNSSRTQHERGACSGAELAAQHQIACHPDEGDDRGRDRSRGFDFIFVETVGIGQEAAPFAAGLVDTKVYVMSPDYGSRLQLQKIAMIDAADVVVVNKADLGGAPAAQAEIRQRLAANGRGQRLVSAIAKRHRDVGVDQLLGMIL